LFPFPKKKGQQTICGTTKFALHAAWIENTNRLL
jgi:hypothetical protein